MIKPIPTHYNGCYYRSRLEARWAIYFDCLDIIHEYEPEGFKIDSTTWYLPDFYFPAWDCYGEVKHKTLTEIQFYKCLRLPEPCLLLDGLPDADKGYYVTGIEFGDPEGDNYSAYKSGSEWGRVMLEVSQRKQRLWYLFGESPESYRQSQEAVDIAKAARFNE